MRILIILFTLFLFTTQFVFSQYVSDDIEEIIYFKKGSELVTLESLGIGFGNESLFLSGGLGYGNFFMEKFCLGGFFNINYVSNNFLMLRTGVFTRYYILNKRLTPIAEANYHLDISTINNDPNSSFAINNHYSSLNVGLIYLVNRNFAIGLTYGYGIHSGETVNGFDSGIILNYHFDRKSE